MVGVRPGQKVGIQGVHNPLTTATEGTSTEFSKGDWGQAAGGQFRGTPNGGSAYGDGAAGFGRGAISGAVNGPWGNNGGNLGTSGKSSAAQISARFLTVFQVYHPFYEKLLESRSRDQASVLKAIYILESINPDNSTRAQISLYSRLDEKTVQDCLEKMASLGLVKSHIGAEQAKGQMCFVLRDPYLKAYLALENREPGIAMKYLLEGGDLNKLIRYHEQLFLRDKQTHASHIVVNPEHQGLDARDERLRRVAWAFRHEDAPLAESRRRRAGAKEGRGAMLMDHLAAWAGGGTPQTT